eukprot:6826364-Prymnesium_polylepis.1
MMKPPVFLQTRPRARRQTTDERPAHHGGRETPCSDPRQAHSSVLQRGAVPAAGAGVVDSRTGLTATMRSTRAEYRISPRCTHTAAAAGGGVA